MGGRQHYTFVQTPRMYSTKIEPSCNRFIDYNTLVRDVNSGGGSAYVKTEDVWELSVPSAQFCCESKIALKIVYF